MAMPTLVKTHRRFWQLGSTLVKISRCLYLVMGLCSYPGMWVKNSTWNIYLEWGHHWFHGNACPWQFAGPLKGFRCHASPVSLEFTISGSDSVLLGELCLSMCALQGGMFRVHALAADSAVDAWPLGRKPRPWRMFLIHVQQTNKQIKKTEVSQMKMKGSLSSYSNERSEFYINSY